MKKPKRRNTAGPRKIILRPAEDWESRDSQAEAYEVRQIYAANDFEEYESAFSEATDRYPAEDTCCI